LDIIPYYIDNLGNTYRGMSSIDCFLTCGASCAKPLHSHFQTTSRIRDSSTQLITVIWLKYAFFPLYVASTREA